MPFGSSRGLPQQRSSLSFLASLRIAQDAGINAHCPKDKTSLNAARYDFVNALIHLNSLDLSEVHFKPFTTDGNRHGQLEGEISPLSCWAAADPPARLAAMAAASSH